MKFFYVVRRKKKVKMIPVKLFHFVPLLQQLKLWHVLSLLF